MVHVKNSVVWHAFAKLFDLHALRKHAEPNGGSTPLWVFDAVSEGEVALEVARVWLFWGGVWKAEGKGKSVAAKTDFLLAWLMAGEIRIKMAEQSSKW